MHLLSDHEYAAFLELWWDDDVLDIREQFPLVLHRTLTIAGQLNVKHPVDPWTGILLTQTTDMLATRHAADSVSFSAWSVKDKSALMDRRTLEKLEIERRYWAEASVPWRLVVNDGLNTFRALNLDWLFEFENALRKGKVEVEGACVSRVLDGVRGGHGGVAGTVCNALDIQSKTAPGAHVSAFRFLLLSGGLYGDFDYNRFSRQALSSFGVA